MVMRQSCAIDSGQRVHIYSANMRRSISLQFYPDGYDLVEPHPVLVSEGYSSHPDGTQGKQRLPEKFHVARAGSEPQEICLTVTLPSPPMARGSLRRRLVLPARGRPIS